MTPPLFVPTALVAVSLLVGCNAVPLSNVQLERARTDYLAAQSDPSTRERAQTELRAASQALQQADESWARRDSDTEVEHWSYLTSQQVAIAREVAQRSSAEQAAKEALLMRDQVRLSARTAEADAAQRDLLTAQQQATASQQVAQASQRQSDDAQAQTNDLKAELRDLNARETERGLVVTIGDVLFESDSSILRDEGLRSVEKLANFMSHDLQRSAVIEGYTDSTGSPSHNQALSVRRSDAVRNAIVKYGVDRSRLGAQGYGETNPVASNDSASGRQMNRRVEIVLSHAAGALVIR